MPNGKWPAGFSRWLFRHRNDDTPIGDLARDAYIDDQWPIKSDNFFSFYGYLNRVAFGGAWLNTLMNAWMEYTGFDYKRVLYNIGLWQDQLCTVVTLAEKDTRLRAKRGFVFIYVLHKDANAHYVGKTVNPQNRLKQHLFHSHSKLVSTWANELLSDGKYPVMSILDEVPAAQATGYEEAYIHAFEDYMEGDDLGMLNTMLRSGRGNPVAMTPKPRATVTLG